MVVCAVFADGTVQRCAMSSNKLSANMLELDIPEKFQEFWKTDQELVKFRKMKHLDERCLACELLQDCGGGCTMDRREGDLYKTNIPVKGHDCLATQNVDGEERE